MGKKKLTLEIVPQARGQILDLLRLGYLLLEKCELREARETFQRSIEKAREHGDLRMIMECLSGLLRLAGEALEKKTVARLEQELDALMKEYPALIPPMAWYCKGAIARYRDETKKAQHDFLRYLSAVRHEQKLANHEQTSLLSFEEQLVRGRVLLATLANREGKTERATRYAMQILARYESARIKSINGTLYLLLGSMSESRWELDEAQDWYQKAHASFLAEHNWYYYLYVLYGYARVARLQQNYAQAYWYLDLMDKTSTGPEFGFLRQEIVAERERLENDAVDLLIDGRRGIVQTRGGGQVSLRKQYILLNILEALSVAHAKQGADSERGLSKAEIISQVWKENYRPEAHDNKLYYNINRLRKLIEPDMRQPQYLLNWKEGYRLAPGLRVHFVGKKVSQTRGEVG